MQKLSRKLSVLTSLPDCKNFFDCLCLSFGCRFAVSWLFCLLGSAGHHAQHMTRQKYLSETVCARLFNAFF